MQRNPSRVGELRLEQPGRLRFVTDRLPWQRSLRWTRPPRDRRWIALGLLLAILLTLVELIGFGLGMQRQIAKEVRPPLPRVVQVILIEPVPDLPLPPEPEPPQFAPQRPTKVRVEAPKVKLPPPPQPAEEDSDEEVASADDDSMEDASGQGDEDISDNDEGADDSGDEDAGDDGADDEGGDDGGDEGE